MERLYYLGIHFNLIFIPLYQIRVYVIFSLLCKQIRGKKPNLMVPWIPILVYFRSRKIRYQLWNRYRICAISAAGQGPFSNVSTFKTTFAPPPQLKGAPKITNITDSGCLVQWTSLKSGGDALQYRVQVTRVKDGHVSSYEPENDVEIRITGRIDCRVLIYAVFKLLYTKLGKG